jgi:hypothetical protein
MLTLQKALLPAMLEAQIFKVSVHASHKAYRLRHKDSFMVFKDAIAAYFDTYEICKYKWQHSGLLDVEVSTRYNNRLQKRVN